MRKMIGITGCCLLFAILPTHAQQQAALWDEYVRAYKSGTSATAPDFSYAGYHFSEEEIPDVSNRKRFDVTCYGAMPNDDQPDEAGIQAAIDAAQAHPGGGVVFFPPGRFLVSADTASRRQLHVNSSNIVLKGSGSGRGGTEIYQANIWVGRRLFLFQPPSSRSGRLTTVVSDMPRGSFWVDVKDGSSLRPGQHVVLRHRSEVFTRKYFGELPLNPKWDRLFGPRGGMQIQEIHVIEQVQENRIRFKNPIQFDLTLVDAAPFELHAFESITECGVEDILFTSNWRSYPEDFVHHKDVIHDSGYMALGMENVRNSWIRNCEFRDWNDCIHIRAGFAVTVENVIFGGKKGHTSIHARSCYGVLIKDCHFNGAHHHGPGIGYGAVSSVITRCTLGEDQNIDIHSGQPYANLFDDIDGGIFANLGGPEPGFPHHGRHLVFWNFRHSSSRDRHYNFWDTERRRNYTIAHPILVGFQSDKRVTFENTGINQLQGNAAKPASLFEAQLALRLSKE
ncbi:MAG TPA: DUF4955 domain-containing protein [Parapedobacter sp.]|uniref:DUF4955 domain-containing protein n=1 Tax=Parapedobacter sp. TaxID=1958893 RepID=UPI002BF686D2|nr:DUF4955 domain-containing protein [Parapedobacter sp.]HWK57639.1 DUF4955 domain-containing protein [Parapedobacter sp.]